MFSTFSRFFFQTDQLTKEKVEEIYKTREEQIHKKQKILEELQKVVVSSFASGYVISVWRFLLKKYLF